MKQSCWLWAGHRLVLGQTLEYIKPNSGIL